MQNDLHYNQEDYRQMMEELLQLDSGLSGWEIDFLESLCQQGFRVAEHWGFTEKQLAKFEQIYEKKFGA